MSRSPHSDAPTGSVRLGASSYDELYRCAICSAEKVVPGLARDCEERHLEEAEAAKGY